MQYSGGGFLCVELYPDKNTQIARPAIVLGEEAYGRKIKGKYADFGGSKDKKDISIYHTILRETREEAYIDIGSVSLVKSLPYIDIPLSKRFYKLVIGRIDGITNTIFQYFRQYYLDLSAGKYSPYVEIGRIRHFYIDDIEQCMINNTKKIPDVNGILCLFRFRLKKAFKNQELLNFCRTLAYSS